MHGTSATLGKPSRIKRRHVLSAALAGSIAVAGGGIAGQALAAEMTAVEKANVQVVRDFLDYFQTQSPDPAKMSAFFTDDGTYQLHLPTRLLPPVVGRTAVAEQFKTFVTGRTYVFKIEDIYAKGPLVVTSRIDTINTDKPGKPAPNVGVFILRDGKIQAWNSIAYVP